MVKTEPESMVERAEQAGKHYRSRWLQQDEVANNPLRRWWPGMTLVLGVVLAVLVWLIVR